MCGRAPILLKCNAAAAYTIKTNMNMIVEAYARDAGGAVSQVEIPSYTA